MTALGLTESTWPCRPGVPENDDTKTLEAEAVVAVAALMLLNRLWVCGENDW